MKNQSDFITVMVGSNDYRYKPYVSTNVRKHLVNGKTVTENFYITFYSKVRRTAPKSQIKQLNRKK